MKIARIAHAGLVVSTERLRCFVDPVLVEPFACGTNRLEPAVRIATAEAARLCDAIVLSHAHPDHFSIRSLDALPRDVFTFYPRGDALVEAALRRLGFREVHAMAMGERVTLEDLSFHATPSRVPFPEQGLLFEANGATCWNLVDTAIDEDAISFARRLAPRIDVLLATYQPLAQSFFDLGRAARGLDPEQYGGFLSHVFAIAPRAARPRSKNDCARGW